MERPVREEQSRPCRGYLQQQLVFGDSLDRFDEEVADAQPGLDVLLDSLENKPRQQQMVVSTH